MVVVMICLVLATLLLTSVLRIAAVQRRQVRQEAYRAQAGWVAESGLSRAAARLAGDAGYTGETWTISADELGGQAGAEVRIRIEPAGSQSNRRTVHVEAVYPSGRDVSVRRTKQITIRIAAAADSGAPGASTRGDTE